MGRLAVARVEPSLKYMPDCPAPVQIWRHCVSGSAVKIGVADGSSVRLMGKIGPDRQWTRAPEISIRRNGKMSSSHR